MRIEFQILASNGDVGDRDCYEVDADRIPVDITTLQKLDGYNTTREGARGSELYTTAMHLEQYFGVTTADHYDGYRIADTSRHGELAGTRVTDESVIGEMYLSGSTNPFNPDVTIIGVV